MMQTRAAVLDRMGSYPALREVAATAHRDPGARPARSGRGPDPGRGRGLVPLGPLGDQRRPAAPDADGAGPRGRRRRRGGGCRGRRSGTGDHVIMVFVPSCGHCGPAPRGARPCASRRPSPTVPAPSCPAAAACAVRQVGRQPPSRGLGLRRARHRLAPLARPHRRRPAVRRGRPVRLRGAHRRGAVVNTGAARAGSSIAIVGLGGVGLCALLAAVAAGARQVIAIDLAEDRLALARELGATAAFNASDPEARRAGAGGNRRRRRARCRAGRSRQGAGSRLPDHGARRDHGDGRPAAAGPRLALPIVSLVAEERSLKGSYVGGCVPTRDIPRYIELYRRGRLPVDRLLTHRLGLDEINEGFDRPARRPGDPPSRALLSPTSAAYDIFTRRPYAEAPVAAATDGYASGKGCGIGHLPGPSRQRAQGQRLHAPGRRKVLRSAVQCRC